MMKSLVSILFTLLCACGLHAQHALPNRQGGAARVAAAPDSVTICMNRLVCKGMLLMVSVKEKAQPIINAIEKKAIFGNPKFDLISTSYIERLNATTRLHMKRLARLTHAFSKKRENFEAAVGLHFAYYNFCRVHNSIRKTPAMAAGIATKPWTVAELLAA